jgi:CRISPR system Cascade subunit CasE
MIGTHGKSLYFSRLLLNLQSRQVMSEIAHPYEMHRTLLRAFPLVADHSNSNARDELGVLFRAEPDEERRIAKLYVQSLIEPDWSFLDRLPNYLIKDADVPGYEYKDIMPVYRSIRNGQILSFRLRANPTKRVGKRDDPMKGKRVELAREEDQINWLIRKGRVTGKGDTGGFDIITKRIRNAKGEERLVPCVSVVCEGKQIGRKRNLAVSQSITHYAVVFDGLLRVTDNMAFLETIIRGIGAGKAFGFGLLTVAPVKP